MKMAQVIYNILPDKKIKFKLVKYFFFTIIMSWSSIAIHYFVSICFQVEAEEFYLNTPDISFMTIILASTNLKDLLESRISRESILFMVHIILNILNIVISLIYCNYYLYWTIKFVCFNVAEKSIYFFLFNVFFGCIFG